MVKKMNTETNNGFNSQNENNNFNEVSSNNMTTLTNNEINVPNNNISETSSLNNNNIPNNVSTPNIPTVEANTLANDSSIEKPKKNNKILIIIAAFLLILIVAFLGLKIFKKNNSSSSSNTSKTNSSLSGHRIISVANLNDEKLEKVFENISQQYPKFGKLKVANVYYTNVTNLSSTGMDNNSYYDFDINKNKAWIFSYIEAKNEWNILVVDNDLNYHPLTIKYSSSKRNLKEDEKEYKKDDWVFYYSLDSGKIFGYYQLVNSNYLIMNFEDNELTKEKNIISFIDMFYNNISLKNFDWKERKYILEYIKNVSYGHLNFIKDSKYSNIRLNDKIGINLGDNKMIAEWGTIRDTDEYYYNKVTVIPEDMSYKIGIVEYNDKLTLDQIKTKNSHDKTEKYNYKGFDIDVVTLDYGSTGAFASLTGTFGGFYLNVDGVYYKFFVDIAKERKLTGKTKEEFIQYIFDNVLVY